MWIKRVPLEKEPIDGAATVVQYDRYAALFIWPEYRLTAFKLLKRLKKPGRVLDIGTGSGRLAVELARHKMPSMPVTGLDLSGDMLQLARQYTDRSLPENPVDYVQANAARLPFPDQSFAGVTSYASIHHWQDPQAVFNEIWRVTRVGGIILIRDNRRMLGNPFYRLAVKLMSVFMPPTERGRWPKSIMSSYTVEELRAILAQTCIRNYRVYWDMGGFDVCIEAVKCD